MSTKIIPFLKWAGGKRWLVSRHSELIQNNFNRYIEPFLGSGAMYFHLAPQSAILSDVNSELIETYTAIKDHPCEVFRLLKAHNDAHGVRYYYKVRDSRPRAIASRAARFIYLNRTCFNGLYRVNLKGVFNVPKGTKNKALFPSDNFQIISSMLGSATLKCCDYEKTISEATSGDFLYIDPPYTVKHNNNNFIKYNETIFSWTDQVKLADCLLKAAKRGVFILISNANHQSIHEIYSSRCWTHIIVPRYSVLASNSANRKMTTELLISNYINQKGEHVPPAHPKTGC